MQTPEYLLYWDHSEDDEGNLRRAAILGETETEWQTEFGSFDKLTLEHEGNEDLIALRPISLDSTLEELRKAYEEELTITMPWDEFLKHTQAYFQQAMQRAIELTLKQMIVGAVDRHRKPR